VLPQKERTEISRTRWARRIIQTIASVAGGHLGLVCTVVVIAQRHGALTTAKVDGHRQKEAYLFTSNMIHQNIHLQRAHGAVLTVLHLVPNKNVAGLSKCI